MTRIAKRFGAWLSDTFAPMARQPSRSTAEFSERACCLVTFSPLHPSWGGTAVRMLAYVEALRRQGINFRAVIAGPNGKNAIEPCLVTHVGTGILGIVFGPLRKWRLLCSADSIVIGSAQFFVTALMLRLVGRRVIWDANACEAALYRRRLAARLAIGDLAKYTIWRLTEAISGLCAKKIVVTSANELRDFSYSYPFAAHKLVVIPHIGRPGDDESSGSPMSETSGIDGPYVLFVGSLAGKQNAAAARFLQGNKALLGAVQRHGVKLVFAGAGTERWRHKSNGIVGVGSVARIAELIAGAACCLAPMSLTNGTSTKVIDYMKFGRSVVVTQEALRGIDIKPEYPITVAPLESFADAVSHILEAPIDEQRTAAMHRDAHATYNVAHIMHDLADLVAPGGAANRSKETMKDTAHTEPHSYKSPTNSSNPQ